MMVAQPDEEKDNGARRMLAMLSSRTHTVVTAFALARAGDILESSPVESQVTFRKLSAAEIDAYVATDEPFDKAKDRAGVTSEICAFSSADDCIRAALVGPAGHRLRTANPPFCRE